MLSATRRFELQTHYTLSRSLDDDSNERNFSRETALNPFDLSIENTYSKQDVRHNWNISGVFDLPGGFTVSAISIARSAFPYTPALARSGDAAGAGAGESPRHRPRLRLRRRVELQPRFPR